MSAMHLVTLVLAGTMYNNDLLGGNYDLHIFSMTLQDSFLSTNQYLMMMENSIVLCAQRILLKNKTILLAWAINVLAASLENIFQEAHVKCDPFHGKYLFCCPMFCGEQDYSVSSCHIDEVQIITEARATNNSLDPNLENEVLLEGGSIVVNQADSIKGLWVRRGE